MKLSTALLAATALSSCASAAVVSPSLPPDTIDHALKERTHENDHSERALSEELWKRKGGGGGGGGRGGGGGSSGSSGSSSSGGSRGGSSSSSGTSSSGNRGGSSSSGGSGGSSGSGGRGSSGSNTGGSTTTGSGPKPAYGGGRYYGGGATTPYQSGARSPGGIVPVALGAGALGFWGSYWYLGAYSYPYSHHYYYHNRTTNQNETKPVNCVCEMTQECGCDDNGNQTYFNSVIGDGSYANLDKSVVNVARINDTDTIFINGTLPNGTTAAGGTEDPFDDESAAGSIHGLLQAAAWWPVITTVIAMAYMA